MIGLSIRAAISTYDLSSYSSWRYSNRSNGYIWGGSSAAITRFSYSTDVFTAISAMLITYSNRRPGGYYKNDESIFIMGAGTISHDTAQVDKFSITTETNALASSSLSQVWGASSASTSEEKSYLGGNDSENQVVLSYELATETGAVTSVVLGYNASRTGGASGSGKGCWFGGYT